VEDLVGVSGLLGPNQLELEIQEVDPLAAWELLGPSQLELEIQEVDPLAAWGLSAGFQE
jgi:cell division septal protein FtsQ